MDADAALETEIARHVWQSHYRAGAAEATVQATWRRVAHAVAVTEHSDAAAWERRFLDILEDFRFLPGGRIQAGAGTDREVTLFNCFVMGTIEDSIPGIFRALEEAAVTMQRGGGVGYDFSTIRPGGTRSRTTGSIASGPVSFMAVWDAMCATIQSTGARRGAMMATLRCDHPDIAEFINAKRRPGRLSHFNLSVQLTDSFMQAIADDAEWPLIFPAGRVSGAGETLTRAWPGEASVIPCRVMRRVAARSLWEQLLHASYDTGEPGVLFIDRINRMNNLWYCERITATNPCGGSINLTRLIRDPFSPRARLDTDRIAAIASTAVRLLDNVIDVSHFPLPQQRDAVLRARRIGLGITGLADALIMLGLRYGDDQSLALAGDTMRTICHAAYRTSIAIAEEKGSFPGFQREPYLDAPFIRALPDDIRDGIARHGIRNSHLISIAPTGTISLLAGNVSSGIEPVFAPEYRRAVLEANGTIRHFPLRDYALRLWRTQTRQKDGIPEAFVTATALPAEAHLAMQATLQRFVDNAISKTIHVPEEMPFSEFARFYRRAYEMHLKGCTTFRPAAAQNAVLQPIAGPG